MGSLPRELDEVGFLPHWRRVVRSLKIYIYTTVGGLAQFNFSKHKASS